MINYTITPSKKEGGKRDNIPVYEFNSNLDVLRFIESKMHSGEVYAGIAQANEDPDWCGGECKCFEDALKCLRYGNPNYTKQFIEGLNEISYTGDDDRTTFMDVEGFCYDMGAVVSGEPECCLNMVMPEANRHVTIYVGHTYPGYVDADHIRNRGIAIANLLTTLLTKNYFVDLKFLANRNYSDIEMLHLYNVSCKSLCAAELAFYCTPEFFRMITLSLDGMVSGDPKKCGQCTSYTRRATKELMLRDNAFFIPSSYDDSDAESLDTPQKADAYVKKLWNRYQELGYSPWLTKDSSKED
jgi:hypothetical protein